MKEISFMRVTGFPSPADEYGLVSLSLQELLVQRPASTYFVRVSEDLSDQVKKDDILVVDRSLPLCHGHFALIIWNGELCLRRVVRRGKEWWLESLAVRGQLHFTAEDSELLWGMVAYVIHRAYEP